MRTEEKRAVKNSVSRLIFAGLAVLGQAIWIIMLAVRLSAYSTVISLISGVIAVVIVLKIYGRDMNAAMKMPWIILITTYPVAGVCIYFLCGNSGVNYGMQRHFEEIQKELDGRLTDDREVLRKLRDENPGMGNQMYYISRDGHYPVYHNTDVVFYGEAADAFEAQKAAVAEAKNFIFMEYHAIEDGEAFAGMKQLLMEKARQGVEVRIIYDDVGSIGFISPEFARELEENGVQCRIFNRIRPILNIFMNNRDHRKITVIDGQVGFTGGYNLANEYFNLTHPYGQWKDTGIRLEGDAIRSLTVMFLEMWNAIKKTDTDYDRYLPEVTYQAQQQAYVQPYADNPLDNERVGENVYMNILNNAKHYAYFITPYLIINDEMKKAFTLAAKRGVDVRIITPGIPDKKMVFKATRSYYAGLARHGVRIFEYMPGFCHAKQCVSDDEAAVVGTINLDYRSLYHHFENGTLLHNCQAVTDVRKDFEALFPVCQEVTEHYRTGRSTALRIGQCILRLFAPLL